MVYSYDGVQIGNYTARCEGSDARDPNPTNVIKTQVMQVGGGGTNYHVGRTYIKGFTESTVAVDVYASNQLNQYVMFDSVRIVDSGIMYGMDIEAGGQVDGIVTSYAIRTSSSLTNSGSAGIRGHSDVKLGQGFVVGYDNTSLNI